jgi:hypothetical protein
VLDIGTGTGSWAIEFGMAIISLRVHFLVNKLGSHHVPFCQGDWYRPESYPTSIVRHVSLALLL